MSRRSGRSRGYMATESNEFAEDEEIGNYGGETEDLDEEQEVTRCLCGQDELREQAISNSVNEILRKEYGIQIDQGLFIQCDKCSVWQHGYCVGLFTNEDVPDKYWCELCKPDFHIFITALSLDETPRTLYKLVNDKRKRLLPKDRTRPKREPKPTRKDRRTYEDSYDAQLQKALRESAKDSVNETNELKKSNSIANVKHEPVQDEPTNTADANAKSERSVDENDNDNALLESFTNNQNANSTITKVKRTKLRSKAGRAKKLKPTPPVNKLKEKDSVNSQVSRDELINQPSRPRYVSEKSSIFELRKRTGAILEWLGRSQIELDEEKLAKIELMDYNEETANDENKKAVQNFNDNLNLMEKLTEQILSWEQRFGKYAP
jgi:hypothetical protein